LKMTDNNTGVIADTVTVTVNAAAVGINQPPTVATGSPTYSTSVNTQAVTSTSSDDNSVVEKEWSVLKVPGQPNYRIAVIGSSTAFGSSGLTTTDSSWIVRTRKYYKALGIIDTIYNLAVGGTNPYHGMPTGVTPPSGRPSPTTTANVTAAIATGANILFISYPSNGYDTYSINESMVALQTIFNTAQAAGMRPYITTTQPRTGFSQPDEDTLKIMKDSIINRFGAANVFNFYDPFVTTGTTTTVATYDAGDGIHLNNAGHRRLFEITIGKNVFDDIINNSITHTAKNSDNNTIGGLQSGETLMQMAVRDYEGFYWSDTFTITYTPSTSGSIKVKRKWFWNRTN
jgi:hypothetical protein